METSFSEVSVNAEAIREAVRVEVSQGLFPGAVVLIGNRDGSVFSSAYGEAQLADPEIPMELTTQFDMASLTKVVATATSCAILYDRGDFDLDAKMSEYLPDHTGKGIGKISMRDLASHTSGFAADPRIGSRGTGKEFFKVLLAEDPKWSVGERYQYACKGTILLSTVVERISGESFGEFCREHIFTPLEMGDSSFNEISDPRRAAQSHDVVFGKSHNVDTKNAGCAIGNAGLFSTADDLSNFCQMMLNEGVWKGKRILSAEVIREFTKRRPGAKFPKRSFIWEIDPESLHRPTMLSDRAYGHSGYTGMSLWIDPEMKLYTIVLTNRTAIKKHRKLKDEQYRARARIGDAMIRSLRNS